jgi:hypothetical protein
MANSSSPMLRQLGVDANGLLNLLLETQVSIMALEAVLSKSIPDFAVSYEKHRIAVRKKLGGNKTRTETLVRLRTSLEQLSRSVEGSMDEHAKK